MFTEQTKIRFLTEVDNGDIGTEETVFLFFFFFFCFCFVLATMKTTLIVYQGHEHRHILDNETRKLILDRIFDRTGLRVLDRCTKSFGHSNDDVYKDNVPIVLVTMAEGHRAWFFLTEIDNTFCSILIPLYIKPGYTYPRIMLLSTSDKQFSAAHFRQNILFECDIVSHIPSTMTTPRLLLLLSDLLICNNESTSQLNPLVRFSNIRFLVKHFQVDDRSSYDIHVCHLFTPHDFCETGHTFISRISYTIKGIKMFFCTSNGPPPRVFIDNSRELYDQSTNRKSQQRNELVPGKRTGQIGHAPKSCP